MTTPPPIAAGSGHLVTGLAGLGTLRWVAADVTWPLEEARRRLDLSPIAAVALGRTLTGAVLLQRIALKEPLRIIVEVRGDGPLGKVIAEADSAGRLRGLVGAPRLPTPEDGQMKIAPLVGRGSLRVTREGRRQSYSSQVALVSGELADDFTHYLDQSEQIRSAVLLGTLPKPTGIAAAGGVVVEALPGTEDEALDRIEGNLAALDGVSAYLERGGTAALVDAVLRGFDRETLDRRELAYDCRCNRASLLEKLRPLAREDPEGLLGGNGWCEAVCAFCGDTYSFTAEELTALQ